MMDMERILKDYTLEKRKFAVDNYEYSYLIADYQYKKEFFAKYFIWDISEREIYDHISMVFSDEEKFINFERQLLEAAFFDSIGDERYNIYLMIIVENNSEFLKNSTIQNDFRYARKIILSVDQVEKFFVDTIPLRREREETYILNLVEKRKIINGLQQSIKNLKLIFYREYFTKIYLCRQGELTMKNNSDMNLAQLIFSFPDSDVKDISMGNRKLKYNKGHAINPQAYKIEKIQSILIRNFRRFKQNCEISFARVNLLFGENGTGKTSLLEAIEFGITGTNCKYKGKKWNNAQVEVKCRNSNAKLVSLSSQKNNMTLSDYWYDVKAETVEDFNLLFNRYNYFDTDWASAFAIGERGRVPSFMTSSQEQVSLRMLQNFLGIDNIEEQKKNICDAYYKLIEYIDENIKYMDKKLIRSKLSRLQRFKKDNYRVEEMLNDSKKALDTCSKEVDTIEKQMEMKSLADTLSLHIKKIERIFMLLISTNEYSELRTEGDEIVAVRSGTDQTVSMSKMSTGQKVCLALAFMFELFLSNENTPNVIMLDEPVANLDDLHMLNLFDVLRRLSLTGTQIFFTTANPDVAKLFRRKFSFLKDDFRLYEIKEFDQTIKISYSEFSPSEEKPIKTVEIC